MHKIFLTNLALCVSSALAAYWQPKAGTRWDIVLSEPLNSTCPEGLQAIDGDLYANNGTWPALRSSGCKTICYFSAGSYEDWRDDAGEFDNKTDLGAPLDGWPGEWWLDTNSANVRRIMKERLDLAVKYGCDAVDPDNVDAYDNNGGGLNLTQSDAVDYIHFLSNEAHQRNLAIGLKNAGAIVNQVLEAVDFEVNEQCEQYKECDIYRPFIDANKPVFGIEYTGKDPEKDNRIPSQKEVDAICNNPSSRGFSTVIKHMSLNEWFIACNVTSSK